MDYLFRWLELRFLSGTQLPLFTTTAGTSANAGETPPSCVAKEEGRPCTCDSFPQEGNKS
jgi:ribonucleoside-diphosphate reductase alpha chain